MTFYVRVGRNVFSCSPFDGAGGGGGRLNVPVQRRTCISVTQPNVTSSTEQSPSEARSSSASQEITIHFMKPEGSLLRSQHLSFAHILNQINPLHNLPFHFFKSYFNIIFTSTSCECSSFWFRHVQSVFLPPLFVPHAQPILSSFYRI